MKGLGGLRPLEMGQSAAKAIGNDMKQNLQVAKSQITGKPLQTHPNPALSGRDSNSSLDKGRLGGVLETNQGQQNVSPQQTQMQQQASIEEKFSKQQQEDQAKLAAARQILQELEVEVKQIRQEREQHWQQMQQHEEQEKEQEELWTKEQEKKQPVSAGQRSGEVKGNKG